MELSLKTVLIAILAFIVWLAIGIILLPGIFFFTDYLSAIGLGPLLKYHPLAEILYMFYLFFIEAYGFVSLATMKIMMEEIKDRRKKEIEEE